MKPFKGKFWRNQKKALESSHSKNSYLKLNLISSPQVACLLNNYVFLISNGAMMVSLHNNQLPLEYHDVEWNYLKSLCRISIKCIQHKSHSKFLFYIHENLQSWDLFFTHMVTQFFFKYRFCLWEMSSTLRDRPTRTLSVSVER